MNMYFVVGQPDQDSLTSLDWKDGEGSSLPPHIHDQLDQGHIICVDKSPVKIKFFRKEDGKIKSRCHVANRAISSIVSGDFGHTAALQNIEVECRQTA